MTNTLENAEAAKMVDRLLKSGSPDTLTQRRDMEKHFMIPGFPRRTVPKPRQPARAIFSARASLKATTFLQSPYFVATGMV